MNKYTLLLVSFISFTTYTLSQTPDFSIYGYAAMDGGTTGGQGGQVIAPTTFEQLQQLVSGTNPVIILIDREFKGPNVLRMGSNKTLFGVGTKGFFNQIGVSIQSQQNIIIRNIRFTMTGVPITNDGENKILGFNFDPDCIAIQADDESLPVEKRKSSHIWVDHCEFFNEDPTKMTNYDRYDGLLDIKNDCKFVTISWNYFHDHHKACLFGKGNSDDFDRTITMHHNKFQNIGSRIPLMRFGKLHMLNNYLVNCPEGNGLNARINSNSYVERNYFDNVKKPIFGKLSENGKAFLKENIFKNCERLPNGFLSTDSPKATLLSESEEFESTTYVPPYLYSAILHAVKDVPTQTNSFSGVGKIQAPIVTSLENEIYESTIAIHPNPTEGLIYLNVHYHWNLLNTLGEHLLSGYSDQINLSELPTGIYYLNLGKTTKIIHKQ